MNKHPHAQGGHPGWNHKKIVYHKIKDMEKGHCSTLRASSCRTRGTSPPCVLGDDRRLQP